MKHIYKTLLIIGYFAFSIAIAKAQTITYRYDTSGNRDLRTITLASKASSLKSGSIDTAFVNDEKFDEKFEDKLNEQKIIIYPNPTHGQLRVEITAFDQASKSSINVYNLKGALVVRQTLLTGNDIIDISASPLGTYVMIIQLGEKVSEWKVIKE